MNRSTRLLFAVVTVCFFVSGAAGLVYQVVWSRYLALFLGHTSYAIVAVLVAFMGGLAIGNAWAGARADRTAKPLAFYAWLEIAIGIYAISFPTYYGLCHDQFIRLARSLQPGSEGLLALKFGFSLVAILPPTILMGATFPVLTRFLTHSLAEVQQRVAALYALNSAGAVVGCLMADFWWIPKYGLEVTLYSAAALNLVAGLTTLVLSFRTENGRPPTASQPSSEPIAAESYSPGELRLALVGIGLSGFVAMLYEVAWTRLLALALGSSTHAFSLMLITFITGIALGAWIVYAWTGLRRSLLAFGWAELALAGSLFFSMFFYQNLSFWFVKIAALLARREQAYPVYELVQALVCFGVMLVPTVCLGMTLPLISRVATTELARTGRTVGRVFAVNTVGTVLGAVLTGLWLMPWLGLARTFAVGIVLNAILGLAAIRSKQLHEWKRAILVPSVLGLIVVWTAASALDPLWQRLFSLGLWRNPNPPQTTAALQEVAAAIPLRYHKDGAGATVDVYAWENDGHERLTLKVNGKADAGTSTDMITQLLLAHIPMLLHPESKHALVVGLGSGMTCGALAQHPTIERIDAIEISPEVVQAARHFARFNSQVLTNPKLHLAIEDAKSFLLTTDGKFDVIVSEPSNPWMAGVAAVFSREYYESCAARLQPGGVVAQWMHVYETTDETVDLVLRTFLSVFPYTSIWQPELGDLILLGGTQPIKCDLESALQRFNAPLVKQDLARVGLLTLPAVLSREMIPQQNTLFTVSANGPVHSDLFPALEYLAQRGFFLNQTADGWHRFQENFSPRATTWSGTYLQRHSLSEEDFKALVTDYQQHRLPEATLFRSLLTRWQTNSTRPTFPLDLWAMASDRIPAAQLRVLRLAPLRQSVMEEATSNPQPLRSYASDLMESYRAERSIFYLPPTTELEEVLARLAETSPAEKRLCKLHLAELAWDRGEDLRCLELGQTALDPDPAEGGPIDFSRDPVAPCAVFYRMAESFWRTGRVREAWTVCQAANATGYIVNAEAIYPPLAVTFRRIQAAVSSAGNGNGG